MDPASENNFTECSRAASEIIGVALLIGMVLAGATAVIVAGAPVITDLQQTAQVDQAEMAMTQLDTKASQVALGAARSRTLQVGGSGTGQLTVDRDAGTLKIAKVNTTGSYLIANATLGAVLYEVGDTTIAYQGGGVWLHQDNGTRMISPAEYHYRDLTLTFPIMRITSDSWSDSSTDRLTISSNGTQQLHPGGRFRNPLRNGHVTVQITSDYHQGWETFLRTRTDGNITHDPSDRQVTANLTVPVTETFDHAVLATSDDSDAIDEGSTSPHGGFDSPTLSGVDRPSPSSKIDAKISTCASGGCTALSTGLADDTLENDTFYAPGDVTIGETDYDTSGGNIHIVVDGDLEFAGSGGPPGTPHHEISGSGMVRFYVKGDVEVNGNTGVNTGGSSSDLLVLVHTGGGDVTTASGTPQFTGLIYAPSASLTINGGGAPSNDNIAGAVVVEDATAHGNGNVDYRPPSGVELEFDELTEITYLHVTENRVNVTSG